MASIALNTVPANVKFENKAALVAVNDPGAEIRGITHQDATAKIQLFQLNSCIELGVGDDVTIRVETSEELAYYKSLETADLVVTVTAVQ